jgi:hypothetical protein
LPQLFLPQRLTSPMKSTFKGLVFGIFGMITSACFFLGVFAFLVWAVYTGDLFRWLREVFSSLWVVAGLASTGFAAMAFHIERNRRQEDAMEKDPAWAQTHPNWQADLRERRHVALRGAAMASGANNFWMLATGCALASLLMLAVTAWRCVRGSP